MPKLSKIRIVGAHYDKCRKRHRNTIIDLNKNNVPEHTLFTLENGCGKGVMLQLISQLLLPNESWGKNNGNTILKMFYKDNKNLLNYTFHVALEFDIEDNNENIIVGAAFTVERKYDEENEETAKLNYFHYICNTNSESFINIKSLPMFENGETKEYGEYKKFINENKDITLYHKSNTDRRNSSYFQYLESYNIHQDDWKLFKRINRSEGGVNDYFRKARDNKALFDKLIIPTIEESLNSEYSSDDSLIEIFKSHIGITKDLPILLEREEDYKELINLVTPFKYSIDEYIRYKNLYNNKLELGKDYYITMKDIETELLNDLEKWKKEKDLNSKAITNCEFQIDSLKISRIINRIELLENELEKNEKQKEENEFIKNEIKNNIEKLEINKLLIPREKKLFQIEKLENEKRRLLELKKEDNLKEELVTLEEKIKSEFNIVKTEIINFFNNHYGYLNYLNLTIEENNKKKNEINISLNEIISKINKFELREENLESLYNKLLTIFNAFSLAVPDKLLEDNEVLLKKYEDDKENLIKTIENKNNLLISYDKEISNLKKDIKFTEENLKILKVEKEDAMLKENEIGNSYYSISNNDIKIFDRLSLLRVKEELLELKDNKQEKINNINKEIWKLQLDNNINKFDYWIANPDILKVKEEIEKLNIVVYTGSEYLYNEDELEKEKLLAAFPLLPYGLIVIDDKIDRIKKNIKLDIIRSQVPIYIRNNMNIEENLAFKILRSDESEKLLDSNHFKAWLSKLDKYEKNNYENVEIINNKIKEIDNLITLIDAKVEKKFYYDLKKEIIINEKEIEELRLLISKRETKIDQINEKLIFLTKEKLELISKIKIQEVNNEKLMEYILLKNSVDDARKQYRADNDIKKKMNHKKDEIEEDISNTKDNIRAYSSDFNNVREEINNRLDKVSKIIDLDGLDIYESYKVIENKPKYELLKTSFWEDIDIREEILKKSEEKDNKVLEINIEIKGAKEYIDEKVKELDSLNMNWRTYEILNIDFDDVLKELKSANINYIKVDNKIIEIKEKISAKKAKINVNGEMQKSLNNEIIANYQKAPEIYKIDEIVELEYKYNGDKPELIKYGSIINENIHKLDNRYFNLNALIKGIFEKFDDEIKGSVIKNIRDADIETIQNEIDIWKNELKTLNIKVTKSRSKAEESKNSFDLQVINNIKEEGLKESVLKLVRGMNIQNSDDIMEILISLEEGFNSSINELEKDKEEKNEICKKWANRASGYVVKISEAIKNMMKSMIYINENNYSFPLVKLENDKKLKLEKDESLIYIMEKFYVDALKKINENENFDDINDVSIRTIKKYISTEKIFANALNGVYPKLLVYKMTEKNEFRYSEPKSSYYDTWEGVNLGEGISAEGSGGQTLSISTFVLMMLLNQRRSIFYNDNLSNIIIMDNPFSNASSTHVLDPIFEIAEQLNFQIIAFAPPELIKEEISERFPVLWDLRLKNNDETNVSFITGEIKYGGRKRKN